MQGLGDEVVAVVALAGQGDEELPRLGGAGVGGDAAKGVPRPRCTRAPPVAVKMSSMVKVAAASAVVLLQGLR